MQDRNFDDLVDRFSKNIYQSLKGQIRLEVLRHDLKGAVPELWDQQALKILDAGGGLGVFTSELALLGHEVTYCDISQKMLEAAQQHANNKGLIDQVSFCHESVQSHLCRNRDYHVILLHAVLEWLANPKEVLDQVLKAMQPDSKLSLLFYNRQSIVYKNLLRGNFYKATSESYQGDKGSLTPSNPLKPDDVKQWIKHHNAQESNTAKLKLLCESGVRVFYDYSDPVRLSQRTSEQVIETEIAFSRQEPYRALGRYYHLIVEKLAN